MCAAHVPVCTSSSLSHRPLRAELCVCTACLSCWSFMIVMYQILFLYYLAHLSLISFCVFIGLLNYCLFKSSFTDPRSLYRLVFLCDFIVRVCEYSVSPRLRLLLPVDILLARKSSFCVLLISSASDYALPRGECRDTSPVQLFSLDFACLLFFMPVRLCFFTFFTFFFVLKFIELLPACHSPCLPAWRNDTYAIYKSVSKQFCANCTWCRFLQFKNNPVESI